jgi:hypothetical protein
LPETAGTPNVLGEKSYCGTSLDWALAL